MSDLDVISWFAIRTKPHKEQLAKLNYEQQGLKVYLPVMRTVVRHARSENNVLRPFFPGYLFLRLAREERNWVAIASTRGAIGAVCFGDQYVPIPDWMINDLKEREEDGAISLAALQGQRLTPGATVNVQFDSETLTQGIVYSLRGEHNVVVLLNFLNRQVKATVPIDSLAV